MPALIEIGQTIRMGYFSQENEEMDGKMRVIDYVKEVGEYIQTSDGRTQLPRCLKISCLMGQCSGHLLKNYLVVSAEDCFFCVC